jgi:hypothetical protein
MENPKNKRFTPEEDDIIRQYYPTGGVSECLKRLCNRYTAAISDRARRLGIKYIGSHCGGLKSHINAFMPRFKPNTHLRIERLNSQLGSKIGKPNYHPAKDVRDMRQERK